MRAACSLILLSISKSCFFGNTFHLMLKQKSSRYFCYVNTDIWSCVDLKCKDVLFGEKKGKYISQDVLWVVLFDASLPNAEEREPPFVAAI